MAFALAAVESWVFDLDNTLYRADSRLFDQVDHRMGAFIAAELNLDWPTARHLQKDYFRRYGTTLSGLMAEHGIDPHAFLAYVHQIDLSPLSPDPRLARALARLGGRKLVYTNGSADHARRVLERLGIDAHFEDVFDIVAGGFVPKPDPQSYTALVRRHGLDPERSVLLEDMPGNLAPASRLGMTTVWVRTDSSWATASGEEPHIHYVTDDLPTWLESVAAAPAIHGQAGPAGD